MFAYRDFIMALPFDLRAYAQEHSNAYALAAAVGDDDGETPRRGVERGVARTAGRPSRAIVVPEALVRRVQQHDVEALRELVRLIYDPLLRFASTIVGSLDEADDVVQEVFTGIWDRGPRWNPSGNVTAYLFASVRNHSLRELRRQGRERRRLALAHEDMIDVDAEDARSHVSALDRLVDAESEDGRVQLVTAVLATCSERQRTAYELRYHRGLTVPAIAQVLGITVKSAEQLVRRVTHLVLERVRARVEETP